MRREEGGEGSFLKYIERQKQETLVLGIFSLAMLKSWV